MAQFVGHESLAVVLTGIGPVFAFADLSVKCTCMVYLTLVHGGIAMVSSVTELVTCQRLNSRCLPWFVVNVVNL